ncbi:UvrD-helicase domain-containing protein [Methylobacillus flagellatus]|uniref:UvrD-helicase domain-containing protein n=1 Tax=Methylobacillus flagellatus TaxID=405 RepID=UPI0010FA5D96|nr:UvrD-helicase domain-containing protein [Methylobacillus flagellatus]
MTDQQRWLEEDADSRLQALDVNASFIVEAPAGAGKTELLTQRYLKLLEVVGEPEEIIAITFTNKAASEMRVRILDSLQHAADSVPVTQPHKQQTRLLASRALARSAARGWSLLQNPSRLRIYTIDSFSSNLARQMPLMSRFGAQPGVRDDASAYYEEAALRTLALLDDGVAVDIIAPALGYFDNETERLTQLLASMLAKRDQWLDYANHEVTREQAEQALARLVAGEIERAAAVLTPVMQQQLMPLARYAASNLPCEESIALLRDWEIPVPPSPQALVMWRALSDLLLTGGGTLRKLLNKNQGFPATPEAKPYKQAMTEFIAVLQQDSTAEAALAALRKLPDVRYDDAHWQAIAMFSQLLRIAAAQLWLVFQANGEVDFVEVAQRALKALADPAGSPTELALRLDYRIQHLLVDEFQDTSPAQVRLLECLTRGWQPGDARSLFLVGDPMQSIYRFRKANVGLFLRVAQHGIGDVSLQSLRLWRNNRSCAAVIDWINHAFAGVFPPADSILQGAIRYRDFAATKPDAAGAGVQVHALVPLAAGEALEDALAGDELAHQEAGDPPAAELALDEDVDTLRLREADTIIDIIRATHAEDPQRKIAVLVRARNHLHALVSRIRRHHPGLNFQAVEIEALAHRQIVQDLLSLTSALHQRADRLHWLAVLRAPWCGLTMADLHILAADDRQRSIPSLMQDKTRLAAMSADGRQRLLHVRQVMEAALSQRGRQGTARWVHGVWLMLGGAHCLWSPGDVRDVQAFFERIAQLEAAGRFSMEQLAMEVGKLYAAPDASANETLQFMTIHKSKGLEFDTVILPGLDRKTGVQDSALLLWEELVGGDGVDAHVAESDLVAAMLPAKGARKAGPSLYDYLKRLEAQRAANEDARVLYVAATRAERSLHLIGVARPDQQGVLQAPKQSFLQLLWPYVHTHYQAVADQVAVASSLPAAVGGLESFVPKLVRLAVPLVPQMLASAMPASTGQSQVTRSRVDQTAGEQAGSGLPGEQVDTLIGVLAHRYLELMAQQGLAAWTPARVISLMPAMRKWLQRQSIPDALLDDAVQRCSAMLQLTLASEDAHWLLQARDSLRAEWPLASEMDGEWRTQRLDLTFVEAGQRWVVDYKSTRLAQDADTAALRRLAEQYRDQLQAYADLFDADPLPVRKAIFFLGCAKLIELN